VAGAFGKTGFVDAAECAAGDDGTWAPCCSIFASCAASGSVFGGGVFIAEPPDFFPTLAYLEEWPGLPVCDQATADVNIRVTTTNFITAPATLL